MLFSERHIDTGKEFPKMKCFTHLIFMRFIYVAHSKHVSLHGYVLHNLLDKQHTKKYGNSYGHLHYRYFSIVQFIVFVPLKRDVMYSLIANDPKIEKY